MMKANDLKTYGEALILLGAVYLIYRAYSGVSGVVGGVVETVKDVAAAAGDVVTGSNAAKLKTILEDALRKKGVNPDNYFLMFPQPVAGQKLPSESWVVKYQGKSYYFVKKGVLPIYSF